MGQVIDIKSAGKKTGTSQTTSDFDALAIRMMNLAVNEVDKERKPDPEQTIPPVLIVAGIKAAIHYHGRDHAAEILRAFLLTLEGPDKPAA